LDKDRFQVVWSKDGWKTTETTTSRAVGSAGHSADVAVSRDQTGGLSWTLHWPEQNRWLGHNVEIRIEDK